MKKSSRIDAPSLESLANLGPASAKMLRDAGIECVEMIRELGALETFLRVKQVAPNVSLNLLWALVGALEDVHWTKIDADTRSALLRELDARADFATHTDRNGTRARVNPSRKKSSP
jgi:DNA transformation protein and related proteins